MSKLGQLSGKVQSESELLRELNDAVINIELDALGKTSEFNIASGEIDRSRDLLMGFTQKLDYALKKEGPVSPDIIPIVRHFESGSRPLRDWIEDLDSLIKQMKSKKVERESVVILEEILSLLDEEFTDDLRRLYAQ